MRRITTGKRKPTTRRKGRGICAVRDCHNGTGKRLTFCEKHYMRMHRRGTLHDPAPAKPRKHSNGYWTFYEPKHPLAMKSGHVYLHRKVVYDAGVKLVCHACGKRHTWSTVAIDHLDGDRDNNALRNLAPACPRCNRRRGHFKAVITLKAKAAQITFRGVSMCITDWAARLGIHRNSLRWRINNGWSLDRALTASRGKFGPQPSGLRNKRRKT